MWPSVTASNQLVVYAPLSLPSPFLSVSDVLIPLSDWDVSPMRSVCSCSCFGCYFGGNGLPPPFCFCFCAVSPPLVLFLVTFLTSNIPCLMLVTSPFRLFHLYIAIVIFLFSTQEYFVSSFVVLASFVFDTSCTGDSPRSVHSLV